MVSARRLVGLWKYLCMLTCPGTGLQIVWHAVEDYLQAQTAATKDGGPSWILVLDSIDHMLQHTKPQEVRHAQSITDVILAKQVATCHSLPMLPTVSLLCNKQAHAAWPLLLICPRPVLQLSLLPGAVHVCAVQPP